MTLGSDAQIADCVLLLGGASGTGKTLAAEAIGRRSGLPWLQVDDLRLTLQFANLLDRRLHQDLFFFLNLEDPRSVSLDLLLEKQIAIAELMKTAIDVVIDHHFGTRKSIIIEGDGIHPALMARRSKENVRAVIVVAGTEEEVIRNMLDRGRGAFVSGAQDEAAEEKQLVWVQLAWRYNQWLEHEAQHRGISIVASTPRETLTERVENAFSDRLADNHA